MVGLTSWGWLATSVSAEEAPTTDVLLHLSVRTIMGQTLDGTYSRIDQESVEIGGDPPQSVPLEDVEFITLRRVDPVLKWHGQVNQDHAQAGSQEGSNGIQDVHLELTQLSPQHKLKSVSLSVEFPGGRQEWSSTDVSNGRWKLVVKEERTDGALNLSLFFEPPAVDVKDQSFAMQVTFEDDSKHDYQVQATSSTSNQEKMSDQGDEDKEVAESRHGWLLTLDGGRIRGQLIGLSEEQASFDTSWADVSEIPLSLVKALELHPLDSDENRNKLASLIENAGAEDQLLLRDKTGKTKVISGRITGLADEKLLVEFKGDSRKLALERVLAIVFAKVGQSPESPSPEVGSLTLAMSTDDDEKVVGTLERSDGRELVVRTAWGEAIELAVERIVEIKVRNDRLVYLSDMEPEGVEEVPFFRRVWNYRVNESLTGESLQIGEKTYNRGLAVHSRSMLTYALDGQFDRFRCSVGFDRSAPTAGIVDCRVWVDDREAFSQAGLSQDGDMAEVDLSVTSAETLRLEIDYGANEDIGDRIIWGSPRLYRVPTTETP